MNCLERERLFGYASRLLDDSEMARVRTHVEACPRCREVVQSYAQVDAALGEWKPVQPSPWFDARLRQAVSAQAAPGRAASFRGLTWVGGLALAALGAVVISGALWLTRNRHVVPNSVQVAARRPHQTAPASAPGVPAAAEVAKLNRAPVAPAPAQKVSKPAAVVNAAAAPVPGLDDEDAVTADDTGLLANFDVLSELPKTETRIAN